MTGEHMVGNNELVNGTRILWLLRLGQHALKIVRQVRQADDGLLSGHRVCRRF